MPPLLSNPAPFPPSSNNVSLSHTQTIKLILLIFTPSICVALAFLVQLTFCTSADDAVDGIDGYGEDVESAWMRYAPSRDWVDEVVVGMGEDVFLEDMCAGLRQERTNCQRSRTTPPSCSHSDGYGAFEDKRNSAANFLGLELTADDHGLQAHLDADAIEMLPLLSFSVPNYGSIRL